MGFWILVPGVGMGGGTAVVVETPTDVDYYARKAPTGGASEVQETYYARKAPGDV